MFLSTEDDAKGMTIVIQFKFQQAKKASQVIPWSLSMNADKRHKQIKTIY